MWSVNVALLLCCLLFPELDSQRALSCYFLLLSCGFDWLCLSIADELCFHTDIVCSQALANLSIADANKKEMVKAGKNQSGRVFV